MIATMLSKSLALTIVLWNIEYITGFLPQVSNYHSCKILETISTTTLKSKDDEADAEGQNLAAEFFKKAQSMGIQSNGNGNGNDIDYEEEDEEDEENAREIPVSEINAFRGVDQGGVGKLAGNVTFTNKELYDSLKERVLESPSAFTSLLSSPDEEEEEDDRSVVSGYQEQSSYKPPSTVPDPELTAGKCLVLI